MTDAGSDRVGARGDLAMMLDLLKGSGLVFAAVVVLVLGAAGGYLVLRNPAYTSEAIVAVRPAGLAGASKDVVAQEPSIEMIRTQLDVIQSPAMIRRVARRVDLARDAGTSPGAAPEQVVDGVAKRLTVENDGRSFSIKIGFRSRDPERAAAAANAFAEEAVVAQRARKVAAIEDVRNGLDQRLAGLRQRAEDAVRRADYFRRANRLIVIGPDPSGDQSALGTTVASRQVSELARTHAELLGRRLDADARLQAATGSGVDATTAAMGSPVVQQLTESLAELERSQATMRARRGPDHPEVVQLERQVAVTRASIDKELSRIRNSLRQEARATASSERQVSTTMAGLEDRIGRELSAQSRYRLLLSDATQARALYEDFAGQVARATEQAGVQLPDLGIVSRAVPPRKQTGPTATLVLALALVAGIVLGCLAAVLFGLLRPRYATPEQVERATGLPVLRADDAADPQLFTIGRRLVNEARRRADAGHPAVVGLLSVEDDGIGALATVWAEALAHDGVQVALLTPHAATAGFGGLSQVRLLDYDQVAATAQRSIDVVALARQAQHMTAGVDVLLVDSASSAPGVGELLASLPTALITLSTRAMVRKRRLAAVLNNLRDRGIRPDGLILR